MSEHPLGFGRLAGSSQIAAVSVNNMRMTNRKAEIRVMRRLCPIIVYHMPVRSRLKLKRRGIRRFFHHQGYSMKE